MKRQCTNGRLLIALLLLTIGFAGVCQAAPTASPAGETPQGGTQGVLENADVIKLLGSNLSQASIIDIIRTSKSRFDVSPAGMAALIEANVPDAVIKAMMAAAGAPAKPAEPTRPEVAAPPPVSTPRPVVDPVPAARPFQPATPQTPRPGKRSYSLINIKFGGGASTVAVGDYKAHYDGYNEYLATDSYWTFTGGQEVPAFAINGGVDLIFRFNRYVGAGVGVGYLYASKSSGWQTSWNDYAYNGHDQLDSTLTLSAIPVRFGPTFFMPFSSSIEAYVSVLPTYYIARTKETEHYSFSETYFGYTDAYTDDVTRDVTSNGLGVEGAFGVKFNAGSHFAFFVELAGRYASLPKWTGRYSYRQSDGYTDSYDATLTYSEQTLNGRTVPFVSMPTSTSSMRNARNAKVDFSGVGMNFGGIIRF